MSDMEKVIEKALLAASVDDRMTDMELMRPKKRVVRLPDDATLSDVIAVINALGPAYTGHEVPAGWRAIEHLLVEEK